MDAPICNRCRMYRVEWPGNPSVEFHLSHGDWIRLLRRSGFEVEDLIGVRPAVGAISRYPFVTFGKQLLVKARMSLLFKRHMTSNCLPERGSWDTKMI